jgi:hypothetical protein
MARDGEHFFVCFLKAFYRYLEILNFQLKVHHFHFILGSVYYAAYPVEETAREQETAVFPFDSSFLFQCSQNGIFF